MFLFYIQSISDLRVHYKLRYAEDLHTHYSFALFVLHCMRFDINSRPLSLPLQLTYSSLSSYSFPHRLGQQSLREQSPCLAATRLYQLYPCLCRKLQRKRSAVHFLRVRREGQQEQRRATQRHVPHLWSQGRRQGEGEGKGKG